MVYKRVSIGLVFPLEFRDFLHSLFQKYQQGIKKIVRNRSGCSLENYCARKKKSMVYKWVSMALCLPCRITIFLAFIILEIRTGHKKKNIISFFCMFIGKIQRKKKKKSRCRSGFPLLFLCIVLKCSVVLFSRARNGHGRAHLDDIGDFGETIPNFPTYQYRKVTLTFLFIISSIAHSHVV